VLSHLSLRQLLERWNEEVLTISDAGSRTVTAQMRDRRWIGSPPATPAELAAWERSTGLSLPPSYRAFAQISNGWPLVDFDYGAVRPVAEIGRVRDLEPGLLQAWEDSFDEDDTADDEGELRDDEVPLLRRCLLLNDGSDNFLLDPGHTSTDGEWATWDFTNWYPGAANGAPSFRAGLERHYASFVRFDASDSVSRTEIADLVEQAYRTSLAGGETGDVFKRAQDYGDLRAEVLEVQVQVLREVQGAIGRVESFDPPVGEPDPVLRYELWPMLVASLRERAPWQDSSLGIFLRQLSEPHRAVVRDLVARSEREGGLLADFSYCPVFDRAVQQARSLVRGGRRHEACDHLLAALPAWRPLSPLHLAPLGVLWDRELAQVVSPRRLLTTARARE
jgi:hypothetical protein